jgi:hypothetical protein
MGATLDEAERLIKEAHNRTIHWYIGGVNRYIDLLVSLVRKLRF